MIYQTGTIATTAGQTKIKGTGTRWKDNLAGISEGCPISYLINNVVYMNTVLSVNSDTEINLTYPVPVAATVAKYQIATFVLDSMSDGVRKMLANQQYIQYFLRNMDTWMTQDGIVEIKTPTGETVKLESIIALKKLIDGKFDKTGGALDGHIALKQATELDSAAVRCEVSGGYYDDIAVNPSAIKIIAKNLNLAHTLLLAKLAEKDLFLMSLDVLNSSGQQKDTAVRLKSGTKITFFRDESITTEVKDIYVDSNRRLMRVGEAGVGSAISWLSEVLDGEVIKKLRELGSGFFINQSTTAFSQEWANSIFLYNGGSHSTISINHWTSEVSVASLVQDDIAPNYVIDYSKLKKFTLYGTGNTIKDSQGNLRAASPVIKIFTDHIELNDESEGIELEKLGTGRYKLKGTLGMNSDASWGGIHGGLVVPNGINNLPLVWADFDVLPDGDIIIETRYRKHTLHPRLEAQRLMTYPEFLDENDVEREDYDYCDIPNGHWIDVRVNMPSDSIYNQKLAEAERLAKEEAEKAACEEVESEKQDICEDDALL
ncbi:phage tail fiber protein [Providencia rustigianii]|uniref:phage tail fiber protein n=1 Tax=Providencia rustigianii TaxID=158850 RepID=UPI0022435A76|nr:hypothetical protein [Providencia rustigianii]